MQLAEATYDMTAAAYQREAEADKALYVQFYSDAVDDEEASRKEGRLMCREVDFVMIMVPGDKYSIIRRPVQPRDIQRFRDRYEAYRRGVDHVTASGTPLKMVSWLSKPQVKELEFLGCATLEQLANMPDSVSQKYMQIQKLKQQARDAIQAAKDAAPLLILREEIDKKDAELSELRSQTADLIAQVRQLQNTVMNQAQTAAPPPVSGKARGAADHR